MIVLYDKVSSIKGPGAYSGFCPGGGLKMLPEGQKNFWVSPPLEQFEPPPELLKLT